MLHCVDIFHLKCSPNQKREQIAHFTFSKNLYVKASQIVDKFVLHCFMNNFTHKLNDNSDD